MTILVTGASGFIGSHIIEEGLRRGYEMWAGIRHSSNRRYLQDPRIHFAYLSLNNPEQLMEELRTLAATLPNGKWDYVIHAAGATKCIVDAQFYRANTEGTKNLVDALRKLRITPRRFLFMSSLSVYGAIREEPCKELPDSPWVYSPIKRTDQPCPNTIYGKSKLQAEQYLRSLPTFPFTILRPTGVYGPRETDYFMMAKSIKQHTDFAVGSAPQEITFIYVDDLVNATFVAMMAPDTLRQGYFLTDGNVYSSRTFSDLLQQEMGVRHVWHIKAPLWFLRLICNLGSWWAKASGCLSALNKDKYFILSQRNWQCDIEPARKDFGFDPQWPLERGVKNTVKWYKENKWL